MRAALQASVAGAAALGALRMGHLYAVALAAGLLSFLFHVARDAYLPSLVARRGLAPWRGPPLAPASVAA